MAAERPATILLGAGGFGAEWWPAIERLGLPVVGAADIDPRALEAARRRFGLPRAACLPGVGEDWTALRAGLVIDATPPWLHHGNALRALRAGMDVIVAKPMALDPDEARTMVEEARVLGRRLAVAQQKRFHPAFLRLRELVASGDLGRLGLVDVQLNVSGTSWEPGAAWRLAMDQPLLLEGSEHHFDLLRWVLGSEVTTVTADSFNPPWSPFQGDAGVVALIEMASGPRVTYRASFAPATSPVVAFFSGWQLEFERAWVEVRDGEVYVNGHCEHVLPPAGNPSLAELNVEVLTRFLGGGAPLDELSGLDNLCTLDIVWAALESIRTGRRIRPARATGDRLAGTGLREPHR